MVATSLRRLLSVGAVEKLGPLSSSLPTFRRMLGHSFPGPSCNSITMQHQLSTLCFPFYWFRSDCPWWIVGVNHPYHRESCSKTQQNHQAARGSGMAQLVRRGAHRKQEQLKVQTTASWCSMKIHQLWASNHHKIKLTEHPTGSSNAKVCIGTKPQRVMDATLRLWLISPQWALLPNAAKTGL